MTLLICKSKLKNRQTNGKQQELREKKMQAHAIKWHRGKKNVCNMHAAFAARCLKVSAAAVAIKQPLQSCLTVCSKFEKKKNNTTEYAKHWYIRYISDFHNVTS